MKSFLIEMYCRLSIPLWATLFCFLGWYVLKLLAPALGIDTTNPDEPMETAQAVLVYGTLILLFVVGGMAGCLIGYFTVARVFRVSESDFRALILGVLESDPKERLLKRYYYWCFRVAYGNEV